MSEKRKEKPYPFNENSPFPADNDINTQANKASKAENKALNIASQQKQYDNSIKSKENSMKNTKNIKNNKGTVTPAIAPTPSANKNEAKASNPANSIFGIPLTEPKDFQEAIFSISFQGAEELNDAAEMAIKNFQDTLEASQESVEAAITAGNAVMEAAEHVNQEYVRFANQLFNESVEASKGFLKCQTLNDAFTLQSNLLKSAMESCLESFLKTNEIALQCTNKALQPINEQTVTASKKLNYPYGGNKA